jgi:hypothetical protein
MKIEASAVIAHVLRDDGAVSLGLGCYGVAEQHHQIALEGVTIEWRPGRDEVFKELTEPNAVATRRRRASVVLFSLVTLPISSTMSVGPFASVRHPNSLIRRDFLVTTS